MTETCRICIIGGGIAGVSTAYHLAERGETDVILLERAELTSGSTWHAAGNLPHFAGSLNLMKMQRQSKQLYKALEEKHGDIGMHLTGAVRLAQSDDRIDEFRHIKAMAQHVGVAMDMLTPEEAKARWPFMEMAGVKAVLWDPEDGHVDPTSVTNAMAADARAAGVTIRRNAPALGIQRMETGTWRLETPKGVIEADVIVNAAGFRASEIAAMIGHSVPIALMEHQYLVTDDIPELIERADEIPMIREPEHGYSYYLRQERKGVLIGPYEHSGKLWATDGVDQAFGQELLPPDLDRIIDQVGLAMERIPLAASAGIKTIVNGPITYTPDGLPLVGPVHGINNYYLHCGSSFGIAQSGGTGRACAEWILDGHPALDLWEMDPRRFGAFATKAYVEARCNDIYDNEYALAVPNEWAGRPAARPQRMTPLYDRQIDRGAVMFASFGWERPAFFTTDGSAGEDDYSFRRPAWNKDVAAECAAVSQSVGVLDLSPFSKFDVRGPGAEAFLNRIGANRMPGKVGSIVLTHALSETGGVIAEFSVTRLGDEHFYVVSAAAAELHDEDILRNACPADGSVTIENITADWGTLVLAGPNARNVLQKLTNEDLSNEGFRWLKGRELEIGGKAMRALRVNFIGELGWELHHRFSDQAALFDQLMDAGAEFGIKPFGMRAMDSMRLEKMYRALRTELTSEYSLLEAGMDRFHRVDKEETYRGKDALQDQLAEGVPMQLVLLDLGDHSVDCIGSEPVFNQEGAEIGLTTSGGYGHRTGKSLAIAYVQAAEAKDGNSTVVELLGERVPAIVHLDGTYDPENLKLRA